MPRHSSLTAAACSVPLRRRIGLEDRRAPAGFECRPVVHAAAAEGRRHRAVLPGALERERVLGWPKKCKLAHAFPSWGYS
jgi:hypothetical protein